MSKFIVILSVLFVFTHSTIFSQEYFQDVTRTESWYTYWGLGYASVSYPSEFQTVLDNISKQEGVSHVSINIDICILERNLGPLEEFLY